MRLFLVVEAMGFSDVHIGISGAFFVALTASLLTAVPLTPAGIGFVEGAVVGLLTFVYGIGQTEALAIVLVDRAISVLSVILFGSIAYAVGQAPRRGPRSAARQRGARTGRSLRTKRSDYGGRYSSATRCPNAPDPDGQSPPRRAHGRPEQHVRVDARHSSPTACRISTHSPGRRRSLARTGADRTAPARSSLRVANGDRYERVIQGEADQTG